MTEKRIRQMSSVYTRSGHTQTRSDSAFSIGPCPAAIRRSFRTASRIAYQTKNTSRKMRPTIGTLSGLVTMSRKFGSKLPIRKNAARKPSTPYPTAFDAIFSRFQRTKNSSATASAKNSSGRVRALTIAFKKPIDEPSLERTRDAAVLPDAPEVHGHQDGDAERQPHAVQHVKPQQRTLADERPAEEREPGVVLSVNQR